MKNTSDKVMGIQKAIQIEQIDATIIFDIMKQLQELHKEVKEIKETIKPEDRFLTRKEVKELLQISYTTIHNWQKQGILHGVHIGNKIYYKFSDIQALLNKKSLE